MESDFAGAYMGRGEPISGLLDHGKDDEESSEFFKTYAKYK